MFEIWWLFCGCLGHLKSSLVVTVQVKSNKNRSSRVGTRHGKSFNPSTDTFCQQIHFSKFPSFLYFSINFITYPHPLYTPPPTLHFPLILFFSLYCNTNPTTYPTFSLLNIFFHKFYHIPPTHPTPHHPPYIFPPLCIIP